MTEKHLQAFFVKMS